MRALKGRIADCAVIDKDWDPPIIRTTHGDFEVALLDSDDALLELVRDFLAKKAREVKETHAAIREFVKKVGRQYPASITIPMHTEVSHQGWHSTVGLEVFGNTISLQRWTGTTGEKMTVECIGELELLEGDECASFEESD